MGLNNSTTAFRLPAPATGSRNTISIPGQADRLIDRSVSCNAFHAISRIRKRDSRAKHNGWVLFLSLLAGLIVGAEIWLYLSKHGIG